MKHFNGTNLKSLRKDLDSILEVIADQHNISISLGNFRYDSDIARIKITCNCPDSDGEIVEPMEKEYKLISAFNKKMKKFGDTFVCQGKTFTIVGWKQRRPKYPLIARGENGKLYKFEASASYVDKSIDLTYL